MRMVLRKSWLVPFLTSWKKMTPLLDQVIKSYSQADKVKIKRTDKTETLLNKIVLAGPSSIQVIADFDATLTRSHLEGKRCESSYGILANSPLVSSKVKEDAWELYYKYHPVEIDVTLSSEEKAPIMLEWYKQCHDVFISSSPPINRNQLTEMVKNSHSALRVNAVELMKTLHTLGIPTLVLSAGLGDIIIDTLNQNAVHFSNVKVMANFMEFNEAGELINLSKPIIHTHNKSEATLDESNSSYFEELKGRQNVILLGDSLGDTHMSMGVKDPDAVLKIGFLNNHIDEHLPTYLDAFDIVLVDDQSMDFVNSILTVIKNK